MTENTGKPKTRLPTFRYLVGELAAKRLTQSHDIALKTQEVMKYIISQKNWNNAQELMDLIRSHIKIIQRNQPLQFYAINVMTHFLKIIREEYDLGLKKTLVDQLSEQLNSAKIDYSINVPSLRDDLLLRALDYRTELESSINYITKCCSDQVSANDVIMTYGKSSLVEQFLIEAAKEKPLHVIVLESSRVVDGHSMAVSLSKIPNIKVTLIPDVNAFDFMPRTKRVIIGVHLIYADGGLKTISGVHGVAASAKHFSVPVTVLANTYELTPTFTPNIDFAQALNRGPKDFWQKYNGFKYNIYDPVFDYVPPDLIHSMIIAHQNCCTPSHICKLVMEVYHRDDFYDQ